MSNMRDPLRVTHARMRIRIHVFASERYAAATQRHQMLVDRACKTALSRMPRIMPDDKSNLRHRAFPTDKQQNPRASIRYIQHASCNRSDADP